MDAITILYCANDVLYNQIKNINLLLSSEIIIHASLSSQEQSQLMTGIFRNLITTVTHRYSIFDIKEITRILL